jgi:hypothetical protein
MLSCVTSVTLTEPHQQYGDQDARKACVMSGFVRSAAEVLLISAIPLTITAVVIFGLELVLVR